MIAKIMLLLEFIVVIEFSKNIFKSLVIRMLKFLHMLKVFQNG